MTDYFVGSGGNDGNTGLSWAQRFLTLNGAEDEPVAAADIVYVGPGVYRENLICDVSGNAGNPITYIADVTGENTDSVGGAVRITGSDNDQTENRADCISANGIDYRTFRGFTFDTMTANVIDMDGGCENWIIEDCHMVRGGNNVIDVDGTSVAIIIRRCIFEGTGAAARTILFTNGVTVDNTGNLIENCIFEGGRGIVSIRIGGITVRNCLFVYCSMGIRISTAMAVGQTLDVENCIFTKCNEGVRGLAAGEIVEDFCTFYRNNTDRISTNVGGNSQVYAPLFVPSILHAGISQVSGFKFPWWEWELSEWSQLTLTGSNEPTEDLRGLERPTTAAKNTWGPHQFQDFERETGTTRTGGVSAVLHDAGVHQIIVPVSNVETTFSVYVHREANYAGTNPRLIIKQPGVADDTTTDAAAASQWNELTTTLTPAASPPYVIVELKSLNTAVAGNYDTFFDDLTVT